MLQQEVAEDFVIATGVQYSVRQFVEFAAGELGISLTWQGEGEHEQGVVSAVTGKDAKCKVGDVVVKVDPRYFRPTEVETLLGDPSKAKAKLGWVPRTTLKELVVEMVQADFTSAKRDALVKLAGFYSDGTFQLDILQAATLEASWQHLATAWVSTGDASYITVPIGADVLPHGATLTGFTTRVNPGIARATTGNRIQFEAYKISSTGSWTLIGSGTYDDGTTNAQTVTKSGLTEVIDRNSYSYALRVTSGSDGASNQDTFNAAAIVRTL
jgi:hypothetical protein